MQLQLTLDGHSTNNKTDYDYEQELIEIWKDNVKANGSDVYVYWIQTEPVAKRSYRKKKGKKEAQYQ